MVACEWWDQYGYFWPELRYVAMRISAQPSSASSCERNWSTYTYDFIHNKRHNKLTLARADDLVYVFSNLRMVAASVNPDASRKNAGAHNIADVWDVEAGDFQSEEDEMDPEVGDDDIDYGSTDMSSDEGLDGDSADEVESDAGDASECGHGGSDSLSESGEGELPSDLGEDNGDHGDNLSESEDGSMDIDAVGSSDGDDAGDFEPMTRKPRANKRKAPTGGAAKKKGKKKGKK
jgi:hypothetical protein